MKAVSCFQSDQSDIVGVRTEQAFTSPVTSDHATAGAGHTARCKAPVGPNGPFTEHGVLAIENTELFTARQFAAVPADKRRPRL